MKGSARPHIDDDDAYERHERDEEMQKSGTSEKSARRRGACSKIEAMFDTGISGINTRLILSTLSLEGKKTGNRRIAHGNRRNAHGNRKTCTR